MNAASDFEDAFEYALDSRHGWVGATRGQHDDQCFSFESETDRKSNQPHRDACQSITGALQVLLSERNEEVSNSNVLSNLKLTWQLRTINMYLKVISMIIIITFNTITYSVNFNQTLFNIINMVHDSFLFTIHYEERVIKQIFDVSQTN